MEIDVHWMREVNIKDISDGVLRHLNIWDRPS